MIRRLTATALLLVLFSVVLFNVNAKEEQDGPNEYNVSGNTEQTGTAITPPNAASGLQVGDVAPDFTLENLEGEEVTLSDLKGKKVFLNFWATWCPPCKVEMPEMQEFHEKYGDEVEVIALNATASEKKQEDVFKFIEQNGYSYPVLLDPTNQVNDEYQTITIPTTYFIGTDGKIQQPRHIGPMTFDFMEDMKDKLD
ncbi:TlpA family protein disulfide reductase [Thalassobacillus hwangdonensis]|uniref:TlpA family protein disulfide reductase n=1 Tax=Thalassobacillus hwangdonensis TaxID=546108 RepID=A0ABW3KWR3_9BACI